MSAFTTTLEVVKVVKGTMNIRTKAVILYEEGITSTKEICKNDALLFFNQLYEEIVLIVTRPV